jgi:glutamyl-tRNA synthetase
LSFFAMLVIVTGRFAPSPTGDLHLGNLRTALLAWLFARSAGGRFLMRMEDLDTGRVRERFYDRQLRDLAAIGIDWDGPVVRQSERTRLYEDALARLDTYPCWCTRAEIREAASAPHGDLPEGAYPGTCRHLSSAQRAERAAGGRPAALRLRVDGDVPGVDDFVLRRGDGAFAYNLAVVVDDAEQGVDQVVRGRDLADSTPRQLLLMRLLGLPEPEYHHVPLVLGADGSRLAKRHGAVTLEQRDESPDEVRTMLARTLGLRGTTPDELVDEFDPSTLPAADCPLPALQGSGRAASSAPGGSGS